MSKADQAKVQICGGYGTQFHIRIREPHHKVAGLIGEPLESAELALRQLVEHMLKYPGDGHIGDVVVSSAYYGPDQVFELIRR